MIQEEFYMPLIYIPENSKTRLKFKGLQQGQIERPFK